MSGQTALSTDQLDTLIGLLEERLRVIADHEWRDRDPDAHLSRLGEVSEAIMTFHQVNRDAIPPRLDHFLGNSSLDKALEWAREARPSTP